MGEGYVYKVGDLVRFTATVGSDVPFECTSAMEKTLKEKIFRVKNTSHSLQFNTQQLELENCCLTDEPEECDLRRWSFSSPMFEPYTASDEDDAPSQDIPEISFNDFLN